MEEDVTTPLGYTAAIVTFFSGLTFENWVALLGVLIGLGTLAINFWRSKKLVAIEQERLEHEKKHDRRRNNKTNPSQKEHEDEFH